MEALPTTKSNPMPQVQFVENDESYIGYFDVAILNKLQAMNVLTIIAEFDDERQEITLNERQDFLSSWMAGVSEARNGNDLHYADYSNNQYAFSAGYEHYHARKKHSHKSRFTHYSSELDYVCHGFVDNKTKEIYRQLND